MPPRILLTGFRPFPGVDINPTAQLIEAIAQSPEGFPGVAIETRILDTAYEACEQQLSQAVTFLAPDAILSFGVNMAADELRLERIAINVDDARIQDNHGRERRGQRIAPEGPAGYWATVPLEEMAQALREQGIPVQISNHAGTYVCNHLFYYALHLVERLHLPAQVGFVHVPPRPEQAQAAEKGQKGLDLETLLTAAHTCVAVVVRQLLAVGYQQVRE